MYSDAMEPGLNARHSVSDGILTSSNVRYELRSRRLTSSSPSFTAIWIKEPRSSSSAIFGTYPCRLNEVLVIRANIND